jgi:protein-disulfide isomerase
MTSEIKNLLIIGGLTIVLLAAGVMFLSAKQPQGQTDPSGQTVYPIDYSKGEKIGSDSAKVKLVEFGDLRCPACKGFEPAVEQVRTKPDVQFIFRNFAFLGPASVTAANAAECAAEQNKYWQYHDYLYKNQPDENDTSMYTSDKLTATAVGLGLDGNQFKSCLDQTKYQQKITDDLNQGQTLGVNSTPTFFLNGKKLLLNNGNDLVTQVDNALK